MQSAASVVSMADANSTGRVVTVVAGAVEGGWEFRRLAAGLLNGNMWQPYWNSGMASGIAWLTPGEIGEIAGVALLRRLP